MSTTGNSNWSGRHIVFYLADESSDEEVHSDQDGHELDDGYGGHGLRVHHYVYAWEFCAGTYLLVYHRGNTWLHLGLATAEALGGGHKVVITNQSLEAILTSLSDYGHAAQERLHIRLSHELGTFRHLLHLPPSIERLLRLSCTSTREDSAGSALCLPAKRFSSQSTGQ